MRVTVEKRPTSITYLGGIRGTRIKYRCTGVRMCEYIHPDLRNLTYLSPNEELWNKLRGYWGQLEWDIGDKPKKAAME